MMSRNGQGGSGRTITQMPTSIRPKKKPAPPRPPQPKINRLQTSQSFNVGQELSQLSSGRPAGRDLIDFHTPPGSPNSGRRNTVCNISTARKDPNEFSYRVGASIFYIKSPLKHSASDKPVQNPFSPPRPAAESMVQKPIAAGGNLQSSINAAWSSAKPNHPTWDSPPATTQSVVPKTTAAQQGAKSMAQHFQSSSLENNNSIKSNYPQASPWRPAGASSSSNASSDRTSNSFSDFSGSVSSQPRYSNIAEIQQQAGKKELTSTLSGGLGKKPTIIRPVNKLPSQASIEASSSTAQTAHAAVISALKNKVEKEDDDDKMQRNYYDLPPEDDFDDNTEDDLNDSSFISPPMPSEPPPPPPPDVLAVDEWVSSTTGVTDYPDTYSDAGQMTAYAIALYDFFPEKEGDLQLQAGDLVYLLRKIDDSWYQGSCGGMEGIFPSNFVNIMVPLPDEVMYEQQSEEVGIYTEVLYDFETEAEGDLGLKAGEKVKLLGKINEDWLYGEKDGTKGQFPTIFVLPVVQDLPIIEA